MLVGAAPLLGQSQQDRSPVSGRERIAWNQSGQWTELRFRIFVDGVAFDAAGVHCVGVDQWEPAFECSATLPPMSAGPHELRISAMRAIAESERSNPLFVLRSPDEHAAGTTDRGNAIVIGSRLADPTDVASVGDDLVLVSERDGRVLAMDQTHSGFTEAARIPQVQTGAGRGLLSIAASPQGDPQQYVFALHSTAAGARLVRFTRAGSTLFNRVTLLDLPLSHSTPRGVVRVGPDRKVYLALDDAGDESRVGDLSSYNGKVLRIDGDGTAADDAPNGSIVFAVGVNVPVAMTWTANGTRLWVAGGDRQGRQLVAVSELQGGLASRRQTFSLAALSNLAAAIGAERIDESVWIADGDGLWVTLTSNGPAVTVRRGPDIGAGSVRALDRSRQWLFVLTATELMRLSNQPH